MAKFENRFIKFLHVRFMKLLLCTVIKTSTSSAMRCYTTLWKLCSKILAIWTLIHTQLNRCRILVFI